MTMEAVILMGQQAIWFAMILGGPLLLSVLVVGTVVSVLQAVTQVQEMTLVFVPKILTVFAVGALAGGWLLQQAVNFGTEMFQSIEQVGR
jgi:flagellar biosynthetic protein FliQ